MKQVRNNVFETNSSSTHSICITKDDILDEKTDIVGFSIGEFGWECDEFSSLWNKASYLYTGLLYTENFDLLEKMKSFLDKNNIRYTFEEPQFETFEYQGKEYKNLKEGYIDHGNELFDFLNDICNDENKLMKFLFSSKSFIITGNDNDDEDVAINVSYEHDEYYKGN